MRSFTLFCIVLLTFTSDIYSQNNDNPVSERNIDIFSRLLDVAFNELENQLVISGNEKLYLLRFSRESEENGFLLLKLKQRFGSYKLLTGNSVDKADYNIVFENTILKTNYKDIFSSSFLGSKKVKRKVEVKYFNKIIDNNTDVEIYSNTINESYEDDFLLDNLKQVENSSYDFAKGQLPEESLLDKVLIPVVVVGASAVAIILFFVIRSK